jgi:hypothetical protein
MDLPNLVGSILGGGVAGSLLSAEIGKISAPGVYRATATAEQAIYDIAHGDGFDFRGNEGQFRAGDVAIGPRALGVLRKGAMRSGSTATSLTERVSRPFRRI